MVMVLVIVGGRLDDLALHLLLVFDRSEKMMMMMMMMCSCLLWGYCER